MRRAFHRWRRFWYTLAIGAAILLAIPAAALAQAGEAPADELTELAAWAAISGAVLPWAAAFILQSTWASATKAVAVAIMCGADAFVINGLTNGWTFDQNYIVAAALVFTAAQTTYRGLWSQFGAGKPEGPAIKRLEAATTPGTG